MQFTNGILLIISITFFLVFGGYLYKFLASECLLDIFVRFEATCGQYRRCY